MGIYNINGTEIVMGGGNTSSQSNNLENKKIIWLGDSIHAYATPDGTTIPFLFQYYTKAKCYNWAQGGMTMAKTGVANYDCYSGAGMVEAMISKNFTEQEKYASDNHGTAQGNFNQQITEMKAMDLNTVDAIIIEFGTNDAMKQVPLDNSGDKFDVTKTGGALRYMIKSLLTANPKLNIIVCNVQPMVGFSDAEHMKPYDSKKQTDLINSICDEYNIPFVDLYNGLGINEYTSKALLQDGLHRNHEGKLKQMKLIINKMNELY